jgi:hypothetical protein
LPQWYHPLDATEYNAVLPCHRECGWDESEKNRIMGYYYKHRGEMPNRQREVISRHALRREWPGVASNHQPPTINHQP